MPFFSVVIPVYNRADLVGATLESVLAQTHQDWEVVVVDDGSSDNSLAVIESYRDRFGPRLKLVAQSNSGNGAARNRGIAESSGRYIALLDSDDLWFEWTLDFYQTLLQQHDFPAFLSGYPLDFEDEDEAANELQMSLDDALKAAQVEAFADYYASSDEWRWFGVSSWVMKREALQGKAFFERHFNGEDHDLALQMGLEKGFVDVQKPATFRYRRHGGNATFDSKRSLGGMELLIENERAGNYPGGAARQRDRLEILSRHVRPGVFDELKAGNRRRAWRVFNSTLGWHLKLGRFRFILAFLLFNLRGARRVAAQRVAGQENKT